MSDGTNCQLCLKRDINSSESVGLANASDEFGHLPPQERWPVIKAFIDLGPGDDTSRYYYLAKLVLIASVPWITELNVSYVVSSLLSRRGLTKSTLMDIVEFAPDKEHQLEAETRLKNNKRIISNKQIGLPNDE